MITDNQARKLMKYLHEKRMLGVAAAKSGMDENTIRDMKKMSKKKRVRLGEGKHTVVFYKGEAVEILCPKLGKCIITDSA